MSVYGQDMNDKGLYSAGIHFDVGLGRGYEQQGFRHRR
jgi:hypothetical protein